MDAMSTTHAERGIDPMVMALFWQHIVEDAQRTHLREAILT